MPFSNSIQTPNQTKQPTVQTLQICIMPIPLEGEALNVFIRKLSGNKLSLFNLSFKKGRDVNMEIDQFMASHGTPGYSIIKVNEEGDSCPIQKYTQTKPDSNTK
ncbi:MAG: hypothetical protein WCO09_02730, partial [bacterium]